MKSSRAAEFGWPGGDHPGTLTFTCPVDPPLRAAILAALSAELPTPNDSELRVLSTPIGAVGRYSLTGKGCRWFIRISANWSEPQLEQAITRFLRDHGTLVNHLERAGIALDFEGTRHRMDIRELIGGRHFNDSESDLRALVETLANCHGILRDFPQAAIVREHAAARSRRLDDTRHRMGVALDRQDWTYFAHDPAWARERAAWLRALVDHFTPHFHEMNGAQCLHAEMHRANVLYRESDGAPVLIDFEEAVQNFAPVAWDLAYLVHRFCLHDSPHELLVRARLAIVREAYGWWPSGISEMMRQTAWLAVTVLVSMRENGVTNLPSEYDKFVRLEENARQFAPLVAAP